MILGYFFGHIFSPYRLKQNWLAFQHPQVKSERGILYVMTTIILCQYLQLELFSFFSNYPGTTYTTACSFESSPATHAYRLSDMSENNNLGSSPSSPNFYLAATAGKFTQVLHTLGHSDTSVFIFYKNVKKKLSASTRFCSIPYIHIQQRLWLDMEN